MYNTVRLLNLRIRRKFYIGAFGISGRSRKRSKDTLRNSEFKNSLAKILMAFLKIDCNANIQTVELWTIYDEKR